MLFDCIFLIIFIAAYVVGSIPTGFIVARLKGIKDIRKMGSGNIGATNISRFLGKLYFFIVFFCDAFKAYIFLSLLYHYRCSQSVIVTSAGLLLIGNAYSLFLKGDGGKGVATLFGIVCALSHYVALGLVMSWPVIVFFTGTAAGASLFSVALLSIATWYLHTPLFFESFCALIFIFWRHKKNISSFFHNNSFVQSFLNNTFGTQIK